MLIPSTDQAAALTPRGHQREPAPSLALENPLTAQTAAANPAFFSNLLGRKREPHRTIIAPVHGRPTAHNVGGSTKRPITSRRLVISMMIAISGAAATPLMIADQNNALIGSSPTKLIRMPTRVDGAIVL
jgi:hypothetical protein